MARRTKDWNEGLARDLKDPEFASEFLIAAMDEGVSLQHALGKVIRAMGVKEFGAKIGMESPNPMGEKGHFPCFPGKRAERKPRVPPQQSGQRPQKALLTIYPSFIMICDEIYGKCEDSQ